MPTREQVWKQVKALNNRYIFYTSKEINYLPKVLNEGENILALTSGLMQNRTWLAVCTNRRVLFLDCGMFFGLRQVQINLDRLQSIESDAGLFFGSIRVYDSGNSMVVRMVLKHTIAPFVRTVQDAMDKYKRQMVFDLARATTQALPPAPPPQPMPPMPPKPMAPPAPVIAPHPPSPPPKSTMVEELERLAKLKAEGHLTDAEYSAAKARLLAH